MLPKVINLANQQNKQLPLFFFMMPEAAAQDFLMDKNHCGFMCGLTAKRCEDSCKVFKHLRLHSLCKTRRKYNE